MHTICIIHSASVKGQKDKLEYAASGRSYKGAIEYKQKIVS